MTNRFKFRCFGNEHSCSLQGMHQIDSFQLHAGCKTANISYNNGCFHGGVLLENVTIMQCTGLKDVNGNLIFESDIVKNDKRKGIIKFGEYNHNSRGTDGFDYGFYIEWQERPMYMTRKDLGYWFYDKDEKTKIIGNIYENPELRR